MTRLGWRTAPLFLARFSQEFLCFSVTKTTLLTQGRETLKVNDTLENIDYIGIYANSGLVGAEGFEVFVFA